MYIEYLEGGREGEKEGEEGGREGGRDRERERTREGGNGRDIRALHSLTSAVPLVSGKASWLSSVAMRASSVAASRGPLPSEVFLEHPATSSELPTSPLLPCSGLSWRVAFGGNWPQNDRDFPAVSDGSR